MARAFALEPFSLHLTSRPPLNKYFIASASQALFGCLGFLSRNISFWKHIDDTEVLKF